MRISAGHVLLVVVCAAISFGAAYMARLAPVQTGPDVPAAIVQLNCAQGELVLYGVDGPQCHGLADVMALTHEAQARATEVIGAPWRDGASGLYLAQSHDSTVNSSLSIMSENFVTRDEVQSMINTALANMDTDGLSSDCFLGSSAVNTDYVIRVPNPHNSNDVILVARNRPDYMMTGMTYYVHNYGTLNSMVGIFCRYK